MLLVIVLVGFIIFFSHKDVKLYTAWVLLFFATNPAAVSSFYLSKGLLGGISYFDVFFILLVAITIVNNYHWRDFFYSNHAKNIFYALLAFTIYKLVVWGFIIPKHTFDNFIRYVVIRERDSLYLFLYMIPAYLLAIRNLKVLMNVITIFSLIVLSMVVASFLFGVELIPILEMNRYKEGGAVRYYLFNYGMLTALVPLLLSVYISKIKIQNLKLLVIGTILITITIILSVTKGLYITLTFLVISSIYYSVKILKVKLDNVFIRSIIIVIVLGVFLNITFPTYFDFAKRAYMDIFFLATEGETTDGSTSRFWQIPALVSQIEQRPFFGVGWGFENVNTEEFDINQFDASDFPLLANVMQYGIVGILIYVVHFVFLFRVIFLLIKTLKTMPRDVILTKYKYEFIFTVVSTSYFVAYFGRFYYVLYENVFGGLRIEMGIHTAILLACYERLKLKESTEE